jgi:hypothetical protein
VVKQTYESCIDFTVAYEDFSVGSEAEANPESSQQILEEILD